MKQDNKELLLRDLCARLPYGVKCYKMTFKPELAEEVICMLRNGSHNCVQLGTFLYRLEHIKPYLFPLSSMTEEQKEEYNQSRLKDLRMLNSVLMERISDENNFDRLVVAHNEIDWLNKNHFDYRGLIPMGLANDATGLNIY